MYKSAYETTPCSGYSTAIKKIAHDLEKYYLTEGVDGGSQLAYLEHPRDGQPIADILVLKPGVADIKPFAHPLRIKPRDTEMLVIDARSFMRLKQNGDVLIAANLDYMTLRNRAILELAVERAGEEALLALHNIHITVFTRWVADAIGRRLALPPEVQIRLTVLTGIYYLSQFERAPGGEVLELDEKQRVQMATKIGRATYVSVEEILRIMDEIGEFATNAQGFVDMLRDYGTSSRFESMNVALLYSMLYAGSWFGYNRNELISVAIEHPPTFLAMVSLAAQERGYKDTALGKLVKTYDKNEASKQFLQQLWHLPVN